MKKIAIVTSTRAEYGLLSPVIKKLREFENKNFQAVLIVTGTHLSEMYGLTINEIKQDKVRIDKEVVISIDNKSSNEISRI